MDDPKQLLLVARDKFEAGLKCKSEEQHVEALKRFDECQNTIKELSSPEASEFLMQVHSEIAISCNVLSMGRLQTGDFKLCQDLLKKAEMFSEHSDRLRAVTYNNYACLFRKTN